MSDLISLRAYAVSRKARGLPGGTLAAVQKAVRAGRIMLVDGKIDPVEADAAWSRNTSVEQQQRGKSGGVKRKAIGKVGTSVGKTEFATSSDGGVPTGVFADGSKDGDTTAQPSAEVEDYLTARARKETALADLAEMEAAELRGDLYRHGDVAETWGETCAAIRARFLVLPAMAAPMVAAPGKTAEVQGILLRLVHEALSELGEGLPKRAGRGKRGSAAVTPAA